MDYYTTGYESQAANGALAGIGVGTWIVTLILAVLILVAEWKIFTKAGKPGWACIIPIYSNIVMFDIIGMEWWHILIMLFVPFAAIVYAILIPFKLAKAFGKSGGFGVLLWLVPVVGYPMLAFGDAKYNG